MTNTFESRFYEFLQAHGYCSEATNYDHLRTYVDYFEPGERVLDLGCGRGEFLELLLDKGCRPEGVDVDPGMVTVCRAKGLTVHQGDAFAFLKTQRAAYNGVFASNFVEHFAPNQVAELFTLARQALKPGGKLLLAVPNPESLIVHLHEFWRDATHVRLYNRQLLEFMFSYSGFEIIAAGENEATRWQPTLTEPAVTPAPVSLSGQSPPPLPPLPGIAQVSPIPPIERTGTSPQPLPSLTQEETPLTLTDETLIDVAVSLPPPPELVASLHTDLSPKGKGAFSRLAIRLRDGLAHFLVNSLLSPQFIPLQNEVENLRRQLKSTRDYLSDLTTGWQEATRRADQNWQTVDRQVKELQVAVARADQQTGRIVHQINAIVNVLNQVSPQGDQLWDDLNRLMQVVNGQQDALQGALQSITLQADHNLNVIMEQTESLRADLARLANAIVQVNQNMVTTQTALQSLRDNMLFLYPAREVYVLGRRRED